MVNIFKDDRGWILVFIFGILIDAVILIYVTVNQYTIFLYLITIAALIGSYFLFNMWNVDERTDNAIDEASRTVIKIFFIALSAVGIVFLLFNIYEIGATLIICAVVLMYLHAIFSAMYAHKMS